MIHDATPSWSGYNYQGKVAIHFLLKHIAKKLKADPNYDFSGDYLLLENREDFEFYGKGNYRSLHQVKAHAKNNYSEYEHAIFNLALNLHQNNMKEGFIHSWKEIAVNKGSTLGSILSAQIQLFITNHNNTPTTSEIHFTTIKEKTENKYVKIMRVAFPSKNQSQIISELTLLKNKIASSNLKLSPFQYNNESFCSIDKIDKYINEVIRDISTTLKNVATDAQVKMVFNRLLYEIDAHVTGRHLAVEKKTEKARLWANDVLAILKKNYEDSSFEYFCIEFKCLFFQIFDEFIYTSGFYSPPAPNQECSLTKIRSSLEKTEPEKLFFYYKNSSPSTSFKKNNLSTALKISEDGIHDILLRIFHEIDHNYLVDDESKNILIYRSDKNPEEYYLPTTIITRSLPKIIRGIADNYKLDEETFEINNFIHDGECCYDFHSHLVHNNVAPESSPEGEKETWTDRIKKMKIINIETAKKDI